MITSYRDFYKPGEVIEETDSKAEALVARGRARFLDVEKAAPMNKEIGQPSIRNVCSVCGKGFGTARGMKSHMTRIHK